MVLASVEELETRQDATTPNAAHSTNLFYVLSLLTDCEASNIVQNISVNSGMEVWRRMVARWEPGVSSRFRGMLQSILFPRHDIPGAAVTADYNGEASPGQRTAERTRHLRCNQIGNLASQSARPLLARPSSQLVRSVTDAG